MPFRSRLAHMFSQCQACDRRTDGQIKAINTLCPTLLGLEHNKTTIISLKVYKILMLILVKWMPIMRVQNCHCLKGRVERIFFFASFKLPLFNENEMVFIIA